MIDELFRDAFEPCFGSETGGIMNISSPISLNSRAWRDLYKAALFEIERPDSQTALRKLKKRLH